MDITWGIGSHELAWEGLIAVYLFLAGIAGGAFLTASLTDLLSKTQNPKVIRSGAYIAPVAIIIGLLLLVVDLGRPTTFWKLLINVNFGSVMSIGVFIVSAFSALSVVYAFLVWSSAAAEKKVLMTSAKTQVASTSSYAKTATPSVLTKATSIGQSLQVLRKPIAIVGVLVSIGTASYTGFLLSAVRTNEFWSTPFLGMESIPFLPILFLVSASSTGLAATLIGAYKATNLTVYKKVDIVLVAIEIVLLSILYASVRPIYFTGSMTLLFWLGVAVVGLLVPLILSIYSLIKHNNKLVVPISAMVVIGGLCLRYFIVFTGQLFR